MSADTRLTMILTAIGLAFSVGSIMVGLAWRSVLGYVKGQTTVTLQIAELAKDITNIAANLDKHIQWHIDHSRR
jgi:hypothetical protein